MKQEICNLDIGSNLEEPCGAPWLCKTMFTKKGRNISSQPCQTLHYTCIHEECVNYFKFLFQNYLSYTFNGYRDSWVTCEALKLTLWNRHSTKWTWWHWFFLLDLRIFPYDIFNHPLVYIWNWRPIPKSACALWKKLI